ncbi:MAG: hypothetical protein ACK40X_14680 [Armatimonadota bacterium]
MQHWRQVQALLLIIVGALMLVRGAYYALERNLGWQGFVTAAVIGSLVIALGIARWRFWQDRAGSG